MIHAVWVASSLLLIFFGVSTRALDWPARIAVRFATGVVIGGTVMYVESLIGIPWTRLSLAIPLLIWSAVAMRALFAPAPKSGGLAAALQMAPILILAIYGVATARETTGDLLYFWGPKGQRFFLARSIDVAFLKFPHYYLMHPDYPPLQPLLYAWNSCFTNYFSYWGATFMTPLYLLASVLAFRGFAAQKLSAGNANAYATLLAALLAFGFAAGELAGGADAQLVMFVVLALSALTFADEHVIAAIALAGAAFTKVEGAAFAIVVIVVYTSLRRDWRRSLILAAVPLILLGSWIAFARHNGLLDAYARGRTALHFDQLGMVLYVLRFEAAYRAMYLPWLAVVAPLAFARHWRAAALPLIVAAAAILYTIFFYLHEANAIWWIKASAERVLLTPLAALLVATAAASE